MATTTRRYIASLDGLRGAAALEVALGHAVWLLWSSGPAYPGWYLLQRIASEIVRYGEQAVVLFFLLSGFVIHLRVAQQRAGGGVETFKVRAYALRRARRLYPALLAALVLTLFLDLAGQRIYPLLYAGNVPYSFAASYAHIAHGPLALLGNLLFVQKIIPGLWPYGSNNPLWSLTYEAVYYVLYPLLFLPVYRRCGQHAMLIGSVVVSLALLPLVSSVTILRILAYYGVWVLGAWLADRYVDGRRLTRPTIWLVAALAGIVILAVVLYSTPIPNLLYDWLWAICLVILMAVALDPGRDDWRLTRIWRSITERMSFLAPFSYTLYIIHFPIFSLVCAITLAQAGSLPHSGWLAFVSSVLVVALAAGLAQFIERPFTGSRRVAVRGQTKMLR